VFPVNTINIDNPEKLTAKAGNKKAERSRSIIFDNETELAKLEFHLKQTKSRVIFNLSKAVVFQVLNQLLVRSKSTSQIPSY